MKALLKGGLFYCLVLGVSAVVAQSTPQYIEGEAIVTFKASADLQAVGQSLAQHEIEITRQFDAISTLRGHQYAVVRAVNRTTAALIAELKTNSAVEVAEPNYISHLDVNFSPNDTRFSEMWGLSNTGQVVQFEQCVPGADISFNAAWSLASASTNEVVVGVIDTGIDPNHPDLASNLWTNPGEIPGNGMDDDGDGFVDDVHGWNFGNNDSNIIDIDLHGTHVSGTIAALGNNQRGVIGVDFKAKIMVLKAAVLINGQVGLRVADTMAAMDYAVRLKTNGVNIVALNASYGGAPPSGAEQAAIQSVGDVGILFCAAAGNTFDNNDINPHYPSSYALSNIIAVAASDEEDLFAEFSCYGPTSVDLAAPGDIILSTIPTWLVNESSQSNLTTTITVGTNVYSATNLQYSGSANVTGLIFDCGVGQSYQFPPFVSGNIALIQRGTLSFAQKVANAMAAGARGAIIYNNVPGPFSGSLDNPGNWINATAISQADGQAIRAGSPEVGTVATGVSVMTTDTAYDYLAGTSMATPHVSGAVAFAAMNFPNEDFAQRKQRILASVDVIPSMAGTSVTGGRLNLRRIVDMDDNSLPDWWENTYFGHLTGTDPNADPDSDGVNNLTEWLVDSNPTNGLSFLQVLSVKAGASGPLVTWQSANTRNYFLQRALDLTLTPAYQTVATNIAGAAGTTTYQDTSLGTNTSVFYRVGVP